mgnify:CR=1 FL=1
METVKEKNEWKTSVLILLIRYREANGNTPKNEQT